VLLLAFLLFGRAGGLLTSPHRWRVLKSVGNAAARHNVRRSSFANVGSYHVRTKSRLLMPLITANRRVCIWIFESCEWSLHMFLYFLHLQVVNNQSYASNIFWRERSHTCQAWGSLSLTDLLLMGLFIMIPFWHSSHNGSTQAFMRTCFQPRCLRL